MAIWAVAFSPDGLTLASGGVDRLVRIWDIETGRLLRSLRGHTSDIRAVVFTAGRPDSGHRKRGPDHSLVEPEDRRTDKVALYPIRPQRLQPVAVTGRPDAGPRESQQGHQDLGSHHRHRVDDTARQRSNTITTGPSASPFHRTASIWRTAPTSAKLRSGKCSRAAKKKCSTTDIGGGTPRIPRRRAATSSKTTEDFKNRWIIGSAP